VNESNLPASLLNHLSTAILLLDAAGRVRWVNQSAEALIGASTPQALGKNLLELLALDDEDRQALQNAALQAQPFTRRQAPLRNLLGKTLAVDYSVTPLTEAAETLLLLEIQEIDRLVRISREESMLHTHATSKQLMRGLAHEIKNPLGGIRGAAELLAAEIDRPELSEYTAVIRAETERLSNLVDALLGPRRPPQRRPLNIHRVLERVARLINAESGQQIELLRDYDPSLPIIAGDLEQLIQAVLNIARNAAQALTESAIKSPRIRLRTRIQRCFTLHAVQHALVAKIDIEDNGPGIDAAQIDEIFYPLVSGRSQGTGLGLPLAQAIIHRHGGMLEAASEPGATTFSIYLPLNQTERGAEKNA